MSQTHAAEPRVVLPRTPSFSLQGQRALVTGAGRGLGLAAAVALAEVGAHVTVAARSATELDGLVQALHERGLQAEAWPLDVTDTAALKAGLAVRPPFQVLVHSAGTNRPAELLDAPDGDVDALLSLNLRATVMVLREVARGLVQAHLPGSLIVVSSQMGHVGSPRRSLYCATKHGVEGLVRSLAWELGPHGIRVNTLCPTFIETPLTQPMLADEAFRNWVLQRIALGRVGQPHDIMGAVTFLASAASAMVTGSALMVDGGWTAT